MNDAARFVLSLGAAIGVHAAVLPGVSGGTGGGAGEGGANAVSVVASDGALDAMIARWQEAPDVADVTDPAAEPAALAELPAPPQPSTTDALALPRARLMDRPEAVALVPPTAPPARLFAALPDIPTPQASPDLAAMPEQPTLPASALSDPVAPAADPVPRRSRTAPVPMLSALAPMAPPEPADPATLPNTGAPPEALTSHPPLDRVPVPPRRPDRAHAQAQPEPAPQAPTRPRTQAQPQPQAAAPALAARGAGGGAQAGNGGAAAAAGDPGARRSALAHWGAQITARIERRAQRQRGRGAVTLALRVDASGALAGVSVAGGSGQPALDAAALAAARAAAPFPRAPDALGGGTHAFRLTLRFQR